MGSEMCIRDRGYGGYGLDHPFCSELKSGVLNALEEGNLDDKENWTYWYPFKTIDKCFKLISKNTYSIIIPYGKGKQFVDNLKELLIDKEHSDGNWVKRLRELTRELQRFSVNVYGNELELLKKNGRLDSSFDEPYFVLNDLAMKEIYKPHTGLNISDEDSHNPKNLMI